jgi:O-antigen/teichoic acid export membrane protein
MSSADQIVATPPFSGSQRLWLAWLRKGSLALTDQAMISGSNFTISILLARWFAAEQYGAYALAFAAFLLVSQLHQALLLEPMSVYGSSFYRGRLRHYLGALLWMHGGAVAVISAVLGAGALAVLFSHQSESLAGALFGVCLASPCILLFWLVRRSFYLELQPASATQGAVLYCTLVLTLLLGANVLRVLSPFTAFLIMGIAALVTSVAFLKKLKPIASLHENELSLSQISQQHWTYGRWALASAIAMWIPTNIYYVLLGSSAGIAHVGELRALMNLTLPVGQTATALSLLFVPYASRARAERGAHALRKISLAITALFALGAICYWAVIVTFRESVLHLFYGGRYSEISAFIPIVALSSVFQTCINGPGIGLRADEKPICVFYAYLVSSVITVGVGVVATRLFGVEGAVFTMLAANMSAFLVAQTMLSRNSRAPIPEVFVEAA